MRNINVNQITLAWLNSAKIISNSKINKLIQYFHTPSELWNNFKYEKGNLSILNSETLSFLEKTKDNFPEALYENLKRNNAGIITCYDDDYPDKLKNIEDFPYVLYYKGNIKSTKELSIAVIGTRKATSYGKFVAEKLTKDLADMNVNIVSGLALGIDSIAHKIAMKYNTKTIGVIGCGIDVVYPKTNYIIYEQIASSEGSIISEFPFGMQPLPSNFPVRNRIISGLSDGVLVIEAQEKSGTLITAGHAAEQGKEIFAVPGNIDSLYSMGTNSLIRDGAKIVTSIEDIVEEIQELRNRIKNKKNSELKNLSDDESKVISVFMSGYKNIHELAKETNYEVSKLLSILTFLEMKGIIKQMPGNIYFLN